MGNNYPKRHGHRWEQKEVDNLRRNVRKGLSIEQIAQMHGRTSFAITCAMERWGIKWTQPKDVVDLQKRFIINGVDYTRKFDLASKIVESVINGDTKYVRMNDKIWSEVTP